MSAWLKGLMEKKTIECVFCDIELVKKESYSITMDTADGAHTVKSCEKCALEFDKILKEVEEIHAGGI
jgi:RNase P subunit RPR2